ncbi:unnamed protein product [Onchocerca flexuosa]|uniref:SH3 domain-containing protein n=1 Tax=Onchocerca flexuosa TaxID=387005 RepID=A0A183HJF6_9BILA|nr:unnamed protein product [Onchocerca flexuosa]
MTESRPPRPAPKPGRVTVYRALYDYTAQNDNELSFNEGDLLYVSDSSNDAQWWPARCRNQTGLIPRNYVMTAEYIEYPLHDAAKRGNMECVKECLDNAVSFVYFYIFVNFCLMLKNLHIDSVDGTGTYLT